MLGLVPPLEVGGGVLRRALSKLVLVVDGGVLMIVKLVGGDYVERH